MKLLITVSSVLLSPIILLSTLFSFILNLCSSLSTKDKFNILIKTSKIIVMYKNLFQS